MALDQARRRHRDYDPAQHSQFVDNLIEASDAAFFGRIQGGGRDSRRPVFIFGLPRSGTTLIEQVLASHSRIHGAGELRLVRRSFESIPAALERPERPIQCLANLDAAAAARVAEEHLHWLDGHAAGHAERVVDKMPDNYLYLGLMAVMFPKAVFIHCRRDLRDVAVSCWMTNFRAIAWANSPEHIATRFVDYRRVMDHWRAALPAAVHEVDYEETVGDLDRSGISLTASGSTTVAGASLYATDGATLSLPQMTGYAYDDSTFQADGPGSLLDVSALIAAEKQADAGGGWSVEATDGGAVNLTGLTSLAAGPRLTDDNLDIYLAATGGGTLLDGNLTDLVGIVATLDGGDAAAGTSEPIE